MSVSISELKENILMGKIGRKDRKKALHGGTANRVLGGAEGGGMSQSDFCWIARGG